MEGNGFAANVMVLGGSNNPNNNLPNIKAHVEKMVRNVYAVSTFSGSADDLQKLLERLKTQAVESAKRLFTATTCHCHLMNLKQMKS